MKNDKNRIFLNREYEVKSDWTRFLVEVGLPEKVYMINSEYLVHVFDLSILSKQPSYLNYEVSSREGFMLIGYRYRYTPGVGDIPKGDQITINKDTGKVWMICEKPYLINSGIRSLEASLKHMDRFLEKDPQKIHLEISKFVDELLWIDPGISRNDYWFQFIEDYLLDLGIVLDR